MKIVVVGGSGQIGTRLCSRLYGMGHEVVDASPVDGVDAVSGAGLAAALEGAQVVIDVSEAPSFDGAGALAFFRAASHRLMAAARAADVRHHLLLSVVGADRLDEGGYFRAKLQQEDLARDSGIPFTIVRATQFMHFLAQIADSATSAGAVRIPPVLVQPVDADDVADVLAACAVDAPANGMVECAGPAPMALEAALCRYLATTGDGRPVVADPAACFFGATPHVHALLPSVDARRGAVTLDAWLARNQPGFARAREQSARVQADVDAVATDFAALRHGRYVIDQGHTRVLFAVSHLGLSTFYGAFAQAGGTLHIDPGRLADSRLSITMPAAGIATGNRLLDAELRSAAWLDSERFAAITLEGRQFRRRSDGAIDVEADLTLHGVTRLVLLEVRFVGAGVNPVNGRYTAGFDVRGVIWRRDFGVTTAPRIGNELTLTIGAALEWTDGRTA